ncbi:MAG: HTTM domain-containing protein [Bryobacterales bacterium]|nr:HTTM domain-containing protein [Bryobacterales bacterium]
MPERWADRQAIFGIFWALALLHDQVAYRFAFASVLDGALTLSAAVLLARPGNLAVMAATAVLHVSATAARLPDVYNHAWFTSLVALALLLACGGSGFGPRAFDAFAAAARLCLAALYFFSGWHKLNADYFLHDTGCGAAKYLQLAKRLPFLPQSEAFLSAAAVTPVALELALPVVLLVRRTRPWAVIAACAFHFALGLAGYPRFSTVSYALLLLFVPNPRVVRIPVRFRFPMLTAIPAAGAAVAAGVLLPRTAALRIEMALFCAYSVVLLGAALVAARRDRGEPEPAETWTAAHLALLLVVLSGLSPYLGLRTLNTFSMYSNLRVEGGTSNHFAVPAGWQIVGWQRDMVEIESSNVPGLQALAGSGLAAPYEQMRAVLSREMRAGRGPMEVVYRRGGERIETRDAARDPRLALPQPVWLWKLRVFRPVETSGARACTV